MPEQYNVDPIDELNKDNVPEEAWNDTEKVDITTGTNRYLQQHMSNTLQTVDSQIDIARETDQPFNTLVVLLARHGEERLKNPDAEESVDYDEGIERYFTQIGNRDYAIDLAVQFAIEASKEMLSELIDNNSKMTQTQYRQLEKGLGYNIIKRIVDDFDLKDEDIDLNQLKGNLSDVVDITDEYGNYVDM